MEEETNCPKVVGKIKDLKNYLRRWSSEMKNKIVKPLKSQIKLCKKKILTHTHTHTQVCGYTYLRIYIYIYIYK